MKEDENLLEAAEAIHQYLLETFAEENGIVKDANLLVNYFLSKVSAQKAIKAAKECASHYACIKKELWFTSWSANEKYKNTFRYGNIPHSRGIWPHDQF